MGELWTNIYRLRRQAADPAMGRLADDVSSLPWPDPQRGDYPTAPIGRDRDQKKAIKSLVKSRTLHTFGKNLRLH